MASIAAPMATTLFGQLQGDWADTKSVFEYSKVCLCAATCGQCASNRSAPHRWQESQGQHFCSSVLATIQSQRLCLSREISAQRGLLVSKHLEPNRAQYCAARDGLVHGGAHTGGFGHVDLFDGTRLAEQGVVLVTINYVWDHGAFSPTPP